MGLDQEDLDAHDGRISRLCDLVGFSSKVLRAAKQRRCSLEKVAVLDPARATRKDALQGEALMIVLIAWETSTRPESAMGSIVRTQIGVGEYASHAIHWQEGSTQVIWTKMIEQHGLVCGISKFYELRLTWVRKPKQ